MTNDIKVSVIITVYNLQDYIKETILSVLNQTYKNIEILAIDDCSTDNSAKIINQFIEHVKYYKTEVNCGVLLTTCRGMELATGDIIAFLDGDDIWHPDKLEEIVKIYQSNENYVLVSHDYEYINESGKIIFQNDHTQDELRLLSSSNDNESINHVMRNNIKFPNPLGSVWLGSAYTLNLKNFDVMVFINWVKTLESPTLVYQDWPLAIFVMASNSGLFGYVNKKLFQYRLHQSNYSGGNHMTIDRAKKIALKGLETTKANINILDNYRYNFLDDDFILAKTFRMNMLIEYQYLLALYDGHIIHALKLFRILNKNDYWKKRGGLFKNIIRVSIFGIFGSRYFYVRNYLVKFKALLTS